MYSSLHSFMHTWIQRGLNNSSVPSNVLGTMDAEKKEIKFRISRSSHQSRGRWGRGRKDRQRRDLRVTLKSNAGHVSMQWLIFFLLYWFCGFCYVVEDQATVNVVHSMLKAQRPASPFLKCSLWVTFPLHSWISEILDAPFNSVAFQRYFAQKEQQ